MPEGRKNWLDRAAEVGNDLAVGLIEEIRPVSPIIDALYARIIDGTQYDTAVRIGLPNVGFRALNQGTKPSKSKIDKRKVECFILSGRVEIDKAAYQAGKAVGQSDLDVEVTEASGVAMAAKIRVAQQIFAGDGTDRGFVGLKKLLPKGGLITVDATGSTANTGASVYAVKTGVKDVALVLGGGNVMDLGDFRDETIYDENGDPIPGRVADLLGWIGLQVPHVNCVGRILNLTGQNGKMVDDSILSDLYSQFPIGFKPDFYVMGRRSARQLQKSRGVVINTNSGNGNPSGAVAGSAPTPTYTADGVPIIIDDSITETDAIE